MKLTTSLLSDFGISASAPTRLPFVLFLTFLAFNSCVRLGLVFFNGELALLNPILLVPCMVIGLLFDIGASVFFLAPLLVVVALWPSSDRAQRRLRKLMLAISMPLALVLVFVGFAEFTFWLEFASRFNFIAVEYLVYSNEVIGNIKESYNLAILLPAVAFVALLVWCVVAWMTRPTRATAPIGMKQRALLIATALLTPVLAASVLDARFKQFSNDAQANELAGNGYFDFWHAFWSNQIDYDRFYKTLPRALAQSLITNDVNALASSSATMRAQERDVLPTEPIKPVNVVLVSIESFSAEFMKTFGGGLGITPNMDRLAQESLLFTRVYATGTRTVRGLEALALSVPPTPGHSIVKRPGNAGLYSLGEVFNDNGYESIFLYGGYGYFDNMSSFFSGNGYTTIDRTAIRKQDIHFENIWGVADEDLFTLALNQLDARATAGKPFFAHIMTTSNHRPYTYPSGRIDVPSKTSREGAVKYTDYAIGDFVERAKKKDWFANTMFVFVADHTHKGRGRKELPIENYHIPLLVYAPNVIAPQRVDTIASQIDVGPTILGLLNVRYRSRFFGRDILREGQQQPRALIANYQTVGMYADDRIVELRPNQQARVVDAATGKPVPDDDASRQLIERTVAYYQLASDEFRSGNMKKRAPEKTAKMQ